MSEAFEQWLDLQYHRARDEMLKSISRVDLAKSRPGFGQYIRAARGSVVASPVFADWNPEPDYFFHWFRDSAIVMDALRVLYEAGSVGSEARTHLQDFVRFSSALRQLDGRLLVADATWRARVTDAFLGYLRHDAELGTVHGDGVVAETRVNPDATLDISSWTRPQHDGAALRALTLLRWSRSAALEANAERELAELLRADLAFVRSHWRLPAYDMWEEESSQHYHTLCVSAAALRGGAAWLEARTTEASSQDAQLAQRYRTEAGEIFGQLDSLWLPDEGYYASRASLDGNRSAKALDISVLFAVIHAWDGGTGAHTAADARIHATLEQLMTLFAGRYAINRGRADGPAMGRYAGDKYFSGGAYYFSTLGAAELCFRAAASAADPAAWCARGDAFLETVRAFTPPSGDLSEQFDQQDGRQTSARHLAWSYAAFISCVAARRAARRAALPDAAG